MSLRPVSLAKCLPAILLAFLAVSSPIGRVGAVPATAIVVYDHGITNQITHTQRGHFGAVNKTYTFTQDDRAAYAYFTAALATANVTWLWYDPDGQLFLNTTQDLQCAVAPCTYVYSLGIRNSQASARLGVWTMTLQSGGLNLYSDHFVIVPVILQDDYWAFTVTKSAPPHIHGDLTVTIHPSNGTWSSYLVYLPFAANITARESNSSRTLQVATDNRTGRVVLNLGGARSDGYQFMLSFDLANGLWGIGAGVFVFQWQESGWGTFSDGYHPVPGSFNITLPANATFLDATGINTVTLAPSITGSSKLVGFRTVLLPDQSFGWTLLYHDSNYESRLNSQTPTTPAVGGLSDILAQSIPVVPFTLGNLSLWTAIMSVFLFTASELLAPAYGKAGVLINRRRLRIAALIVTSIFLAVTVYELILLSVPAPIGR
jgi:hypothetical protein